MDLEEQFTFYASYHHDTMNKIIHILCVWPILWSAIVFAEYTPVLAPESLNSLTAAIHPFNLAFAVAVFYALAYIVMDKKAGTLAALMVFGCLLTARKFYFEAETNYGYPAWAIAAAVHVACWIAQFIGHGAFEGRAPALLDNLVQAFLMAPLFVLLEVLFNFGYRKDFQAKMWKRVEKEIAKHKSQSKQSTPKGKKSRKAN